MPLLESVVLTVVAFGASTIGAISGIGGGIIIKPVLDSLGTLNVSQIHFMSGCTVLAMSVFSLIRAGKGAAPDMPVGIYLSAGAIAGGILGKSLFSRALAWFSDPARTVGISMPLLQTLMLLAINILVLLYVLNKKRVKTFHVHGLLPSLATGCLLGCVSSFLGIGGGPLNIAALGILYSMGPKRTALNSLFVIFCSQAATLILTILNGTIPSIAPAGVMLMCMGGIAGAFTGRALNARMSDKAVEKLFLVVLVLLILMAIRNIFAFL